MKNTLKILLIAVLSLTVMFAFTACGSDKVEDEDQSQVNQLQTYTNAEGKTQEELNKAQDNFYGTWSGDGSGHVEELYGNLEITILEDGTFKGNVTGEDFGGTWEKVEDGIEIDSIYITGKMYFGEKCNLVIYEDEATPVVLTKKN